VSKNVATEEASAKENPFIRRMVRTLKQKMNTLRGGGEGHAGGQTVAAVMVQGSRTSRHSARSGSGRLSISQN
jgi:hypothetical protein